MGCSSSVHAAPPSAGAQSDRVKPQPVTPDSRLLRGQAYYAAGKVQEALKELNATIASWPTYARAYLERGNIRLDQKDYSLAVGDYTMALQLQGNLLQAYLMRCHARMALRQFSEALQDAREAERLDPENAQVRALKAQVRKAAAGVPSIPPPLGSSCGAEEEDAFAGVETPKSTPSPSVRKLCMVCMDSERECRLRPCMHAALCVQCAEGLMARGYGCPICSSKIDQVERGTFTRTFTVEEAQGIVASARIVNSATSPGKSALGRRFTSNTANAPSLDDIVEGDEEAHAAEAAMGPAGRGGSNFGGPSPSPLVPAPASAPPERATSSISGTSSATPLPPPPVQLDPHPLVTRAQAEAGRRSDGSGGSGEGDGAEGRGGHLAMVTSPSPRPPPLPGAVDEDLTLAPTPRLGGGAGVVGGSGEGGRNSATPGGGMLGLGLGEVGSPRAMSPMASAQLANSLADWIDEHQHSSDVPTARPAAAAAAPAAASAPHRSQAAAAAAAAAAAQARRRTESFTGFSMSSSSGGEGGSRRAAQTPGMLLPGPSPEAGLRQPGPVAEAGLAAGARAGPVAEGCAATGPSPPGGMVPCWPAGGEGPGGGGGPSVVGRVFFHGAPPAGHCASPGYATYQPAVQQRVGSARSLVVRLAVPPPLALQNHRYSRCGCGAGSEGGGANGGPNSSIAAGCPGDRQVGPSAADGGFTAVLAFDDDDGGDGSGGSNGRRESYGDAGAGNDGLQQDHHDGRKGPAGPGAGRPYLRPFGAPGRWAR